jgi:shikimate 5-dehydrogenase
VRSPSGADLLVNCTPVGLDTVGAGAGLRGARRTVGAPAGAARAGVEQLSREAEALNQLGLALDALHEYSNVVDLVYRTGGTPLLACARALGLRVLDGAEILARQGALSLRLWTGREPPLEVMRKAAHGWRARRQPRARE